ncbi:MAG: hypothetical protein HFH51_01660 [Lachnospiraceae bacterium]|nr:hypothetical protein [Lachnospiraceae bacterium]
MSKKNEYAKALVNAYSDGLLKIVWNTSGFSLGVDPQKKDLLPELKEKEFVEYVFSIVKIIAQLAEDKEGTGIPEDDLKIAKEIYAKESDLKNHLYIKKNSKINCFKLLETQIISYRNEENPKEIAANSAILKMIAEKDDEDISSIFEISKRDLGELIEKLAGLKEMMDSIEKEREE